MPVNFWLVCPVLAVLAVLALRGYIRWRYGSPNLIKRTRTDLTLGELDHVISDLAVRRAEAQGELTPYLLRRVEVTIRREIYTTGDIDAVRNKTDEIRCRKQELAEGGGTIQISGDVERAA